MKKVLIGAVLFLILILFYWIYKRPTSPETKFKNIVMISVDSLGANHLDEFGYNLKTTPSLDEFIDSSFLFSRSRSPAPWTIPTHMSVFTSMYPSEHKIVNKFSNFDLKNKKTVTANFKNLNPSASTLAEVLRNNGFTTGAFTGDAGLNSKYGFSQGFDIYFDKISYGGFTDSIQPAINWLTKNKNRKLFLFLHGYDVNENYKNKEDSGLYKNDLKASYDQRIKNFDKQFKKIIEKLKELGLYDNSLIIIFSDHGLEYFEHGRVGAGNSLYGELINVPLVFHFPGQIKGKKINSLVSTLDIMPTILGLLKINNPVPKQIRGIDLTRTFSGIDISRDEYSETDFYLRTHLRSIETPDGWKLIMALENGRLELYDLNSDPKEKDNIVDKYPLIKVQLENKLKEHLKKIKTDDGPWTLGCPQGFENQCLN